MKTARFRVYVSGGWITCLAKNNEAKELIGGKLAALRPGPRVPEPYVPFEFPNKKSKPKQHGYIQTKNTTRIRSHASTD